MCYYLLNHLNLIAVILKVVRMYVCLLLIPTLNALHYLTQWNNDWEQINLPKMCGDIVDLKYCRLL